MLIESVLAASMVEGVGSIHGPGLEAKALQVNCQVPSHHGGCLVTKKKGDRAQEDEQQEPLRATSKDNILWLFPIITR